MKDWGLKDWIMELCPEIADWQAEMIAEAAHNKVLDEREACAEICESDDWTVAAAMVRARRNK